MKNKIKTCRSASKRFKITKGKRILRKSAFKGHILEKKSSKRKRGLSQKKVLFKGEVKQLKRMLPYSF